MYFLSGLLKYFTSHPAVGASVQSHWIVVVVTQGYFKSHVASSFIEL